jgi:sec-independent protein translocase protein TatB
MFDIGFSELLVIGVVALIVIGPERLPKVARTVGHLYGRLQRYVSNVKNDISQEMELEDLRKVGEDFRQSVESVQHEVQTSVSELETRVVSTQDKVMQAMTLPEDLRADVEAATRTAETSAEAVADPATVGATGADDSNRPGLVPDADAPSRPA